MSLKRVSIISIAVIFLALLFLPALPANASAGQGRAGRGTAWAWGDNDFGQLGDDTTEERHTPVRVLGLEGSGHLAGVVAVAGGSYHSIALKSDGTVWAWGDNDFGQLGDGSTQDRRTPVQVVGPEGSGHLTGVVAVAGGYLHSIAVKSDGTAWAWGRNNRGQLGDDSTEDKQTPVQVVGPGGSGHLEGVVAVAAGSWHSIALKSDGTAWAWGYNYRGELGDGTTTQRQTPVQVVGQGGSGHLTNVAAVAAGHEHSIALKSDGTVWAWGFNASGELGDGTTENRHVPVQVVGQGGSGHLAGVVAVTGGSSHSIALMSDGTAWAWGGNDYGQLGDGTTGNKQFPVQVLGPGGSGNLEEVTAVAAGTYHSIAIRSDETPATACGYNDSGQLGDGSTENKQTPVQVVGQGGSGNLTGVVAVAGGYYHSIALASDGTAWAWGRNYNGELGDGTTDQSRTPVQVVGQGGSGHLEGVVAVAAGSWHSIALKSDGTVWAWGYNNEGQLGDGSTEDRHAPVQVLGPEGSGHLEGVVAVAGGHRHSIAVKSDGTAWAWGGNNNGQLGDDTTQDKHTPVQVLGPEGSGHLTDVVAVAAGYYHSIARKSDGTAWAWGRNNYGQLGDGSTEDKQTPVQVLGQGGSGNLTGVVAGSWHSIALESDGTVWAWGYNSAGQLGDGSTEDRHAPVQVVGPGGSGHLEEVTAVAGGYDHSIAVKSDGTVWGWGYNNEGQLGNNSTENKQTPVQVLGQGGSGYLTGVVSLAGGGLHTLFGPSDNPSPSITSISPESATVGGPAFTLTVEGTGFVSGSLVKWNGVDKATTFVSSSRLTASIPQTDIEDAGTAQVTVFNPSPGGGTSEPWVFMIIGTPSVESSDAGSIGTTGATLNGNISDTGGQDCDRRGFRYREQGASDWNEEIEEGSFGTGEFSKSVGSLAPGKVYEFEAMARNDAGWGYGQAKTFQTLKSSPSISSVIPTSGPPGTQVTLKGSNFGDSQAASRGSSARGASYVSFGGTPASVYHHWSDTRIVTVVPPGAGTGAVTVVTPAGSSNTDKKFKVTGELSTWYLAEGTNAWGFATYISITNPNDKELTARLTYMDPNAPASGTGIAATRTISLAPLSQTTVSSAQDIGEVDFSTKVECLQGENIAVDRTMYWRGQGRLSSEAGYHSSIGTTAPSRQWYLPEGSSAWGFETWTLVQNPNPNEARLTLTYMTESQGPQSVEKVVPPFSRATWSMESDIAQADSSVKVTSDIPVIAERSMYKDQRREGSCSVGASTPAKEYFLAEGATGFDSGFTTYVLVQNPNSSPSEVALTYQTDSGEVQGPSFTMAPDSRKTVRLNDELPGNTSVSTLVQGSLPVVAERAMYWDTGAFHASVGLPSAQMSFYLPDGQTSEGVETWTLVQNPNPGAVRVEVTYLPQGGGKALTFKDEIPRGSRKTYDMSERLPAGRASIVVRSLDGARPVVVERSMYWNSRGAGTDTVGGFSQ